MTKIYVKDKFDYLQGCICDSHKNCRHGLITAHERDVYVADCKETQKRLPHLYEDMKSALRNCIAFALILLVVITCTVMFNINSSTLGENFKDITLIFCGNMFFGVFAMFVGMYLLENVVSFINNYIELHYV